MKCSDCGAPMNEGEAKTFTVCDACWDKAHPARLASDSNDLLACPFCGWNARFKNIAINKRSLDNEINAPDEWAVMCTNPGCRWIYATVGCETKEEAAQDWNTRAS